jgi:ketol-acid reductoisomerase
MSQTRNGQSGERVQEPARFYGPDDATLDPLREATVAVIGYGNLGRSFALNLRDSGVRVVVGNVDDAYRARAADDGFPAAGIAEAVGQADVVYLLVPDQAIPAVFAGEVAPRLRPGAALVFASGYALAYRLVEPPAGIDTLLLAPRMLGEEARTSYVDGSGFLSYVSVE